MRDRINVMGHCIKLLRTRICLMRHRINVMGPRIKLLRTRICLMRYRIHLMRHRIHLMRGRSHEMRQRIKLTRAYVSVTRSRIEEKSRVPVHRGLAVRGQRPAQCRPRAGTGPAALPAVRSALRRFLSAQRCAGRLREGQVDASLGLGAALGRMIIPIPITLPMSAAPPTTAIAIHRIGFGPGSCTAIPVIVRYMNA